MKIEVNFEKRYFVILVLFIGLVVIAGVGYSYGTSNPSVVGHTVDEIAGLSPGGGSVKIIKNCTQGTFCDSPNFYSVGQSLSVDCGAGWKISKCSYAASTVSTITAGTVAGNFFQGIEISDGDTAANICTGLQINQQSVNTGAYSGRYIYLIVECYSS